MTEAKENYKLPFDPDGEDTLPVIEPEGEIIMPLVQVRYYSETAGILSPRAYTYYSEEPLRVGDVVLVPVRDTTTKAQVVEIDIPESTVQTFRDKVKVIPAASRIEGEKEDISIISVPSIIRGTMEFISSSPSPTSALVEVNPLVDPRVTKLLKEAEALKTEALALKVTDGPSALVATNSLVMVKGLKDTLETFRTSYTRPLAAHTKHVNDSFKAFMDPLEEADRVTRAKMLEYHREQDRLQAEQEEINRLRMEAAKKEMALSGELSEPVNLVEVQPAVPSRHLTNMGEAGLATTWKWNVEDITKVPAEYMMIDSAKVGKVVRAGLRSIPGINIYPEKVLKVSGARG